MISMNIQEFIQKVWQWLEAFLQWAALKWQELITWSQTDIGVFINWLLGIISAILAIVVVPYTLYKGVYWFYRLLRPAPRQPTPTDTLLEEQFRQMRDWYGEGYTAARTLDDVKGLIAEHTAEFFGRREALNDLERFISQHDRGVLVLTAPWGVGKSAVLARWARNRQEAGASVAYHFFNRTLASTTQPVQALRALIVQLRFLAGAKEALPLPDEPEALHDRLAVELQTDASAKAPRILIVDALDEADSPLECLAPPSLGAHTYVIASARAEDDNSPDVLRRWLTGGRSRSFPVKRHCLPPLSIADVLDWVQSTLEALPPDQRQALAKRLHRTTDGIALFLRYVLDDLRRAHEEGASTSALLADLENLPAPFSEYAAEQLLRLKDLGDQAWSARVQRLFALLTLIKAAIAVGELNLVLNPDRQPGSDLDLNLDPRITRWLSLRTEGRGAEPQIAFQHPRLAEVFGEGMKGRWDMAGLVKEVRTALLAHCRRRRKHNALYALTYGPLHLIEEGYVREAAEMLTDVAFLRARLDVPEPERLIRLTHADFQRLLDDTQGLDPAAIRQWLNFWAESEPILLQERHGFGGTSAPDLLIQLAADMAPETAPARAASPLMSSPHQGFRQLTGKRKPSALLRVLDGHHSGVTGALALEDGRIVSWGEDGTLRLWNRDGRPLATLDGHQSSVYGALVLDDGHILSWSRDDTLRLWDGDGRPLASLEGHWEGVRGALALEDGCILSWSDDSTLRLWNRDGSHVATLNGHQSSVYGALVLDDGHILSWSRDDTLRLWDGDGRPLATLDGHQSSVYGALVLDDGHILSWSEDGTLRLWNRNGSSLAILKGHQSAVWGALVLDDGHILSWSGDGTLRLWDSDGAPLATLEGHQGAVLGALALKDDRILSWSGDVMRLWDGGGKPFAPLEGHQGPVSGALALFDGRMLSWSWDGTLRLWDEEGRPLVILEGHQSAVLGALALEDDRILSWSRDGTLRLWDGKGRPLASLDDQSEVWGVLVLDDGHILSWSGDGTLRLWDGGGKPLVPPEGHQEPVNGVLALDDSRILSWSWDGALWLWKSDGSFFATLKGHEKLVSGALALKDDRILSWSEDKTLRLWDGDGRPLATLKGHQDGVNGALALEDDCILSWSEDKTLRLWSGDGMPLAILEGHRGAVRGALALSNGRILSWSKDRTLRMWDSAGRPLLMWAYPPSPITHVVRHSKDPHRFWVCAGKAVFLITETTTAPSPPST
jgi:WD40 repeat protein